MDLARSVTTMLMKHRFSDIFLEPVDSVRDNAPDYHEIVKNPMDLQTVSRKLSENAYATWQAWAADIDLIFDNCIAYNGESYLSDIALHMKSHFHKRLTPFKSLTYDGWVERTEILYRRLAESFKAPPPVLRKTLTPIRDEPLPTLSESELNDMALKLSLLSGGDLIPVIELLKVFGVDLWRAKGEKAAFNIKTLPPQALLMLAEYLKEGKQKD
jgi:hypothetical protein